jgi:hypothetical protein
MKIIYYQNGEIIGSYDDRTLESEKNIKINILKEYTTSLIRSKIEQHEEINCANGLYDNEPEKKNSIINWLIECRNFYLLKKEEILSTNTIENLDNISISKNS